MQKWLAGGGVGVMALAVTLAAKPEPGPWLPEYPAARAQARKSGKPLLVVFR